MPAATSRTTVGIVIVATSSPLSCQRSVGISSTPKMPRWATRWTASATRKRLPPRHDPDSSAAAATSVTPTAARTVRGGT
ncbi:MAG: hypothetical protein DME09_07845 [Candidatus Rokuibacteriota bacterium]|nr:MAG: hypothetical protein DME09_07845 [Candidatus Rokubacteria bacterium]